MHAGKLQNRLASKCPASTLRERKHDDGKHYAPIAEQLAAFVQQKENLLAHLRDDHKQGPKSEPFDEDKAWRHLTYLAEAYFWRPIRKQKTLLPSQRVDRLDDLTKALGEARSLVNRAMKDDVGFDLFRGCCLEAGISPEPPQGFSDHHDWQFCIMNQVKLIKEVATGLAALETAARRATREARAVPKQVGVPRGRGVLPLDYTIGLAACYWRNTGVEPVIGPGRFAEFVEKFLIAVGRCNDTSNDYVVEAFKYQTRKNAAKFATFFLGSWRE